MVMNSCFHAEKKKKEKKRYVSQAGLALLILCASVPSAKPSGIYDHDQNQTFCSHCRDLHPHKPQSPPRSFPCSSLWEPATHSSRAWLLCCPAHTRIQLYSLFLCPVDRPSAFTSRDQCGRGGECTQGGDLTQG